MARIDELPVELLKAIFLYLRRRPAMYEKEPNCRAVSQVCARWRAIALSTPELWTLIPLKSMRWTQLCLARSRPALLTIDAEWLRNTTYEERGQTLQLVYPELYRVSSLRISSTEAEDIPSRLLHQIYMGLNSGPATTLSDLSISCVDDDQGFVLEAGTRPAKLPVDLFAGAMLEALTRASFKACLLSQAWSQMFIPAILQSLILVDCIAWENVNEMIDFFHHVPNLGFLSFQSPGTWRSCTFDVAPSLIHAPRSVQLPQMHDLRIDAPFLQGLVLLIYFSIPVTTSVDVRACDSEGDLFWTSPHAEPLLRMGAIALREHFAGVVAAQGHGYRHVGFAEDRIMGPCTAALAHSLRVQSADDFGPPFTPVHLTFGVVPDGENALQQHASYALYLAQPMFSTAESMSFLTFPNSEVIRPLFHGFTALRNLYLCERSFEDFAAAIVEVPVEFRIFPALRRLQVTDASVDFFMYEYQDEEDEMAAEAQRVQESIQHLLNAIERLAQYEHFELLVLAGSKGMSDQTLGLIRSLLGEGRVECDWL